VKRGEDIVLPVASDSSTWLASVECVARNFVHAALLPELGPNRAFTLPALALSYGELVAALQRRFPDSPSRISFEPDPETVAMRLALPAMRMPTHWSQRRFNKRNSHAICNPAK